MTRNQVIQLLIDDLVNCLVNEKGHAGLKSLLYGDWRGYWDYTNRELEEISGEIIEDEFGELYYAEAEDKIRLEKQKIKSYNKN